MSLMTKNVASSAVLIVMLGANVEAADLPIDIVKVLSMETAVPGDPEREFPSQFGGQSLQFDNGKMATGTGIARFPFDLEPIFVVTTWQDQTLEIAVESTDPRLGVMYPASTTVRPFDIDRGRILVRTSEPANDSRTAIHSVVSGDVSTLASSDLTFIPGSINTFTNVKGAGYVGEHDVIFEGVRPDGESGLYGVPTDGSGEAFAVVDQSTPFPTLKSLGISPSFFQPGETSGDRFTFRVLDSFRSTFGLYVSDLAGNVTPVAEFGEPMPGGVGRYRGLGSGTILPSMDGDLIAFAASDLDSDLSRIFITDATTGETEILLDNTEIPTSVPHPSLFMPSISGNDVAFLAGFLNGQALLVNLDGVTSVLLESGDVLDGKVVDSIEMSPFSFDDGQVAFSAFFTDNTSAIYVATVPGVWSGGVLVAGLGGLIGVRRRREALV